MNNTLQTALIICPSNFPETLTNHPLLGLTIGERLFRSLQATGIKNVAFTGPSELPQGADEFFKTISMEELRLTGENFIAVPSDLVFDPDLLSDPDSIPKSYPIRYFNTKEWDKTRELPTQWPEEWNNNSTAQGRGYAIRVIDRKSTLLAEQALLLSLGKSADGIISKNLNRKISTAISRRLAPYPIKPNHITAIVFLIGIASGPLAWLGTYAGFALGAFCYWFSAVLDGCDGEISRLKYQGSPLGAWLDTIVDDLVCFSYITGMYIALSRNAHHQYWFWCGSIAIIFYLTSLLPRYYVMAFSSGSGDYQKLAKEQRPAETGRLSKISLAVRDVIFRTDFLPFYAMITAFIGCVPAFALPFAIGTIAAAIDSLMSLFKFRKNIAQTS
jgi:phosphatidylglycerophosphate synthase